MKQLIRFAVCLHISTVLNTSEKYVPVFVNTNPVSYAPA
jgi:hypothetical protein